ncbi:MAG: SDR family oxidoreductase, partial [Leptospira sp.]|nr:SDR family oxidoreductase [Leptospira sp.]
EVLLNQGAYVFATDINFKALSDYARKAKWDTDRVRLRKLDIRDNKEWEKTVGLMVKTWGQIDVMFNIAGYMFPGYIHETPAEEISKHMDINAKGVMFGTRAAAKVMVKQKYGHIINIASLAGVAPIPGISLYSASKFAVRGFSLAVAEELSEQGVFVTVVCPDAIRTPMLDLQTNHKEAALVFSGSRILTLDDIEKVIMGKVLPHKPREVLIPLSRGILAKFGNAFPGLSSLIAPALKRKGLRQQKQI